MNPLDWVVLGGLIVIGGICWCSFCLTRRRDKAAQNKRDSEVLKGLAPKPLKRGPTKIGEGYGD